MNLIFLSPPLSSLTYPLSLVSITFSGLVSLEIPEQNKTQYRRKDYYDVP